MYTTKCQKIERKIAGKKSIMVPSQNRPFIPLQKYSEYNDISPLSFEEQAGQHWYPMESHNLDDTYPSHYGNNYMLNIARHESELQSYQREEFAENQQLITNDYGADTGDHHHHPHYCHVQSEHRSSCPGHKCLNCNNRVFHICEHFRHDHTEDGNKTMLTSKLMSNRWSDCHYHKSSTDDHESGNICFR